MPNPTPGPPFELCRCGHPWLHHDVEDLSEDPKPSCCVEGCSCGPGRYEFAARLHASMTRHKTVLDRLAGHEGGCTPMSPIDPIHKLATTAHYWSNQDDHDGRYALVATELVHVALEILGVNWLDNDPTEELLAAAQSSTELEAAVRKMAEQ